MIRMIPLLPLISRPRTVRLNTGRIFTLTIAAASLLIALSGANAQAPRRGATSAAGEDESVLFKEYRGVQLGMTAEEVRKKLGDPKDKGDEQDFFIFNDTETAQIVYDKAHKVVTISADFLTAGDKVPTAKQVFASDVEAKADGSIYKMVRFPKAGYWLSYNRTGGASPLTTVTLQKIQ
jgi:outer membrane protein assembly factor BamE (lipoprotein component of BamABCDE complex)